MRGRFRTIYSVAGLALCLAFGVVTATQAQDRDKYVISAKAGGINLVSGDVTVRHKGSKRDETLAAKDNLESGDTVSTGMGGRVEVLLNPGSYMRVSGNAEFELTDASLDSLQVNLHRGSAVVEVASADGVQIAINVRTPQSNALIVKGGIYRFNVLPNEMTEIFIRKGRVLLGKGEENRIKGGQKVVIRSGRVEVAKFDKNDQDALDLWSKDRAKTLARASEKLKARNVIAAFRSLNTWDAWNIYSASYSGRGTWIYNPSASSYCFYPGGGRSWSSPYGHTYTNGGGWGGGGNPGGGGYPRGGWPGGGTGSGGGNGGGNSGGSNPSSPTPASPPPATPVPSAPPMTPMPSSPVREMPSEPAPRREYTREP